MTTTATAPKGRTRTTFTGDEIYHVWAHQKYPRGRAGNVYFEGDTIYSYGSHFPMARLVTRKGKTAVLVTNRRYSSSTSNHTGNVRMAVSHLERFYVPDPSKDAATSWAWFKAEAQRLTADVGKPRTRKGRENVYWLLKAHAEEANRFAAWFGIRGRLKLPADLNAAVALGEELTAKEKQAEAKEEAKRERQAAENVRKEQERADKWLAGESDDYPYRHAGYDRLRVKGSRIQTSKGVVLEVEQVKPLLRMVRSGKLIDLPEMEVAGYTGVRLDGKTVSVGCHTVEYAEVERIAKQLGL